MKLTPYGLQTILFRVVEAPTPTTESARLKKDESRIDFESFVYACVEIPSLRRQTPLSNKIAALSSVEGAVFRAFFAYGRFLLYTLLYILCYYYRG